MVNGQFRGKAQPAVNTFQPPVTWAPAAFVGPEPINIGEKVGLLCLNSFVFFAFSRVLDLKGTNLHLPLILGFLTITAALFQGGIAKALSSNITRSLVAFTVWVVIGVPFGYWKGGSVDTLKEVWLKTILMSLAIAGLITTYKRLRTLLLTLASAFATATLLLIFFGVRDETRLALPQGELANSNQVALAMMLGLPLLCLVVGDRTRPKPLRFLFALILPFTLRVLVRAGSRAAIIAILLIFVMLLFEVSIANKIKLVVAGVVISLIGLAFLTNELRVRYSTLISDELVIGDQRSYDVQDSARRSSMSRRALVLRGIVMTVKHPIFGVGLGNFAPAYNANKVSPQQMDWTVSHNSYLQLSSETGIPGFLFYTLAMLLAWYRTRAVSKRAWINSEWAELGRVALGIRVGLLGLFILMCFGSLAYDFYFPCFAGLVVGLEWCAKQLIQKEAAAASSVPGPSTPAPRLTRGYKQPLPA